MTLPNLDLIEKYAALQQAQQSLAVQTGKIGTAKIKRQGPYAHIPKEQIVEELMLEYLKMTFGKLSLVEKKSFWALNNQLQNSVIVFSRMCR